MNIEINESALRIDERCGTIVPPPARTSPNGSGKVNPMHTRLIICLDGVGPDYLASASVPTLDELGRRGWRTVGLGAMPAVTNVNNVSIITGGPPALHGITSNFYLDRVHGQAVYMEAADFILAPTIFQRATAAGRRSALLTAKDKLRTLLARGATEAISAESPPPWLVEAIGPPPPILSVEVNHWLVRAATALCRSRPPDLVYLSTTDYAQHMHAPASAASRENLATLLAFASQPEGWRGSHHRPRVRAQRRWMSTPSVTGDAGR